jgi:tetratricopeptide (TPR) repeat protein
MRLRCSIIVLSFLFVGWQSPRDTIRRHYEAAEAERIAGNPAAAEREYTAILAEGYARMGEVSLGLDEPGRAIPALEAAREYGPTATTPLVNLAIAYFDAERYGQAVDLAQQALLLEPENGGAQQMLGKSYFMLGDMAKSISALETAARLSPDNVDVLYTLGIAYLRNRQTDQAKLLYESMTRQFGERPQLHVVIGRAYRQSGLLAEAAGEFRKAIALDSRFPRAHYYLGITYLLDEGQSRIADALEEFKLEVAENPNEFLANYYLGVVYVFQRQWQSAITALEKAAAIAPNDPDPYFQLGQAYQELNQHERAVAALKKSIAFNPDLGHNKGQVTSAHHRLAQSLIKLGQVEAGRQELKLAADLKAQAFKLEQQTQTTTPAAGINSLRADDANSTEVSLRQGLNAEASGPDTARAQELRATAAFYEKVVATAHNNIGLLRAEQKDFDGAAKHFARAIKWNPQQEGLAYNLGLAYYKAQYYEQAIPALEQELKLHPDNHAAVTLLGLSCFEVEQYQRTSELLSSLVGPTAADVKVRYTLAAALIRLGKIDAAESLREQMQSTPAAAEFLNLLLAEKYLYQGERKTALSKLSAVVTKNSEALLVHYYAGLLYLRLNKPGDALREFERELKLNPDDTQAKFQLGKLKSKKQNHRA